MGTFNFCLIIFQKIFLSNRFADEQKKTIFADDNRYLFVVFMPCG